MFITLNLKKRRTENKFKPSNEVIKENEDLIIDDNENFIVVNKESGQLCKVELNSKI